MEIKTQAALEKALAKTPDGEFTLAKGSFNIRITGAVAPILIVLAGAHLDIAGSPSARPQVTARENSQVTASIRAIIAKRLEKPLDQVTGDADIMGGHTGALGGDSLDHVEIIMDLEDLYDIHIPDDLAEEAGTLAGLVKVAA